MMKETELLSPFANVMLVSRERGVGSFSCSLALRAQRFERSFVPGREQSFLRLSSPFV